MVYTDKFKFSVHYIKATKLTKQNPLIAEVLLLSTRLMNSYTQAQVYRRAHITISDLIVT